MERKNIKKDETFIHRGGGKRRNITMRLGIKVNGRKTCSLFDGNILLPLNITPLWLIVRTKEDQSPFHRAAAMRQTRSQKLHFLCVK